MTGPEAQTSTGELSDTKRRKMRRLRKWKQQSNTLASSDGKDYAESEIERMADSLELSDGVVTLAKRLYELASEKNLIHGRSIEALVAASIYISSRQMSGEEDTRSLDEIASTSRVDSAEVGRTYRYLCRELDEGLAPAHPSEYVERYVKDLNRSWMGEGKSLSQSVIQLACQIIEAADDAGLVAGKSPSGYAAAAIYTAALELDEDVTQTELAEVFDGSEVTIRDRYKEQVRAGVEAGILNPENFDNVETN